MWHELIIVLRQFIHSFLVLFFVVCVCGCFGGVGWFVVAHFSNETLSKVSISLILIPN